MLILTDKLWPGWLNLHRLENMLREWSALTASCHKNINLASKVDSRNMLPFPPDINMHSKGSPVTSQKFHQWHFSQCVTTVHVEKPQNNAVELNVLDFYFHHKCWNAHCYFSWVPVFSDQTTKSYLHLQLHRWCVLSTSLMMTNSNNSFSIYTLYFYWVLLWPL